MKRPSEEEMLLNPDTDCLDWLEEHLEEHRRSRMFVVNDGRPWYKQVISGALFTGLLIIMVSFFTVIIGCLYIAIKTIPIGIFGLTVTLIVLIVIASGVDAIYKWAKE